MIFAKPLAGAKPDRSHRHAYGLRHAFLFNERGGTAVADCVGNLKATFNGSPVWSQRLHGGAIYFDGSSDLSLVAGQNVFGQPTAGPYTIIAGVMQTGSQTGFQTLWANGANGLYVNGGQVQLFSSTTSAKVLTPNKPYIVSASAGGTDPANFADGELDYVINGSLDARNNYVTLPQMSGATIGGHGSERFIGEISFIYIYDRYITPATMAQIQNEPFAMFYSDSTQVVDVATPAAFEGAVSGTGAATASLTTYTKLDAAITCSATMLGRFDSDFAAALLMLP